MDKRICTIKSCGRPLYARGSCRAHYVRALRGRPSRKPIRSYTYTGKYTKAAPEAATA